MKTINGNIISWNGTVGTVFASDIGRGNPDRTLSITSPKSGVTLCFEQMWTIRDPEGDVEHWLYSKHGIVIKVLND